MSKIGIDIADTDIDVWPSLIKKSKTIQPRTFK